MSKRYLAKVILLSLIICTLVVVAGNGDITIRTPVPEVEVKVKDVTVLPEAKTKGKMSVEEALNERRSRRAFKDESMTLAQLSQILWAGQGRTGPKGLRTAPSAGALYPIELYAVVSNVKNLEPGVYRYEAAKGKLTPGAGVSLSTNLRPRVDYRYQKGSQQLRKIKDGELREKLQQACLGQSSIGQAPVSIVIAADYARTAKKYEQRAQRYVHIEVGHIGQNIYLQAESLGLGTCAVGAFDDEQVKDLLGIREDPLYVMPVGVALGKSEE